MPTSPGIVLPSEFEDWIPGSHPGHSIAGDRSEEGRDLATDLREAVKKARWKWPKREIFFISDPHADADAFKASLNACGVIKNHGRRRRDFELTKRGRRGRFLIGGDCFDKGPNNLALLRTIHRLQKSGARMRILAGNHDSRVLLGIHSVGLAPDPRTDHFFLRMGPKAIPLLKEIATEYLQGANSLRGIPKMDECRRILYPPKTWFSEFRQLAGWMMPDASVKREIKRMRTKAAGFESDCDAAGLNMRTVYAAARKWQDLFLKPSGEFYWFFKQMRLAYRAGSFLFIHAGLDDTMARIIRDARINHINRTFKTEMLLNPFGFYYGPLANTIRTKYRANDLPLTNRGAEFVRKRGIHAVVHGHANRLHGQRLALHKGLIHIECDTTLDRNSRDKEGLSGCGAGVTVFRPNKTVLGISNDYPRIKVFSPKRLREDCLPPRGLG